MKGPRAPVAAAPHLAWNPRSTVANRDERETRREPEVILQGETQEGDELNERDGGDGARFVRECEPC